MIPGIEKLKRQKPLEVNAWNFDEYILSNGSYRLALWRKEPFGIRLYKSKEYNGNFVSKNSAVFLTHFPLFFIQNEDKIIYNVYIMIWRNTF